MEMAGAETGVVIAAGAGRRMRESAGAAHPKPAALALGVPLVVRVLRRLAETGVRRAVVVTGCRAPEVEATARTGRPPGLELVLVHNDGWERQNGLSVLAARHAVDGAPFVLTMADHLYSPLVIEALRTVRAPDVDVALAVDRRLGEISDIADATRVRTGAGGRIAEIGKGLRVYDAVDTGVFLCTSALFEALESERDARGDCSLSEGVARVARRGRGLAVDIPREAWWQDVDNAGDLARVERKLLQHEASPLVPGALVA
jgi:1L-myo-inositol 1-phosphate cytidylyltransferase